MTFNEYQAVSRKTAIYPRQDKNFTYPAMCLAGEAGEVANKIGKLLLTDKAEVNQIEREALQGELGDVWWFMAQLATELELKLDDVAEKNIKKLQSRLERNKLHGVGDTR